jgi:hypothetical protein
MLCYKHYKHLWRTFLVCEQVFTPPLFASGCPRSVEFYSWGFILPDNLTTKEREAELRKAKLQGKPEEEGDE